REIPEESEELPSRYETPEYQAFLKTQFSEENPAPDEEPGEVQIERSIPEEPAVPAEEMPEAEAPAEEPASEPEVIPFKAETAAEEIILERVMPEETAEDKSEAPEEASEEPAVPAEEVSEAETPAEETAEEKTEVPAEASTEPEVSEEASSEPVSAEEEQPEAETAEEEPAEPETVPEEPVNEETAAEENSPEVSEQEAPERSVSEESEELPSRYETPEYQAFLKEQEKEDQPVETGADAEEGVERTVPEETAENSQDVPEQTEEGNEELPSRYDTPEYQAFLKEQEKEEIPFTDEEVPAEESGERSTPEDSEEKDPGPRRKRIAEQNRRKKKKSKKKEKYVSKIERGIVEEKPVPVQEPEPVITEDVHTEPEVIPFGSPVNEEPEEIQFVNPRDEEQQAEVIPFLSDLKPEEPTEGEAERTRSISLSSIEAEASEPIPEPSVSFEELKYKRNPLIKRITDPSGCMANVTEQTSRSALSILMGLILKWGLSCVVYVAYVANVLNKDAFSYARMVFTDASWLWFRIVLICIAAELLTLIPAKLICRGNRKAGAGKIMTVMLEADFSPLLFMAGGALLFVNTASGIAVTAVAAAYELLIRVKALEIATECRKIPALIASLLFFCVLALLGYYGLKYMGGDLLKIYSVISEK
ncbi:MAG: APC family permease, partial [Solobacterium sp.]|nr:APC family permease [Solobacterium sp.]